VCSAVLDDTQPFDTDGCDPRKDCKTVVLFCAVARGWCGTLPVREVSKELVGSISMVHPGFPALRFAWRHCAFYVSCTLESAEYNFGLSTAHVPCIQRSTQDVAGDNIRYCCTTATCF
jgi:hypothetical protein